jgi:hypothetical protein
MRTADPRPLFLLDSSPPCGSLIARITSNQFRRNSLAGPRPGRTLVSARSKCHVMTENFAYLSRREARSHESRMNPEGAACGPRVSRSGLGQSPWGAWRSVWHPPQASVLTRIWPAPGEGPSHSRSDKGFLNCSTTAACILGAMFNSALFFARVGNSSLSTAPVVFLSNSDQSRPQSPVFSERRVYGSQ